MVNIPLPRNPWLRRRRLAGARHEVERLHALCRGIHQSTPDSEEAVKQILTFLSSEYTKNEVYYSFVRMPGVRRVGWYIWSSLQRESRNAAENAS